tara:strand:- start:472 stop:1239 length:768 start_codon:yes stop_codon:yes gene_type:complete
MFITLAFYANSQTTLTVAENFHVKTIFGEPIWLFPLLDDENKIVVIDFFSTTCGPCQDYAADFQACYENFGENQGNTYFLGINWGNDNQGVREFDSIFGLTFPSVSGSQGGGNLVYQLYDIQSYPTVIIITPDHNIFDPYVWYPDEETITNAVIAAGGILVGVDETTPLHSDVKVFPNPAISRVRVNLNLKNDTDLFVTISDIMGREVKKTKLTSYEKGNISIDLKVDGITSGYYLLRVFSTDRVISTSKISIVK